MRWSDRVGQRLRRPDLQRLLSIGLVVWVHVLGATAIAQSNQSRDYARMGHATWSAFMCSQLASTGKVSHEQERLFQFGYAQGQQFLAALEARNIRQEDISTEVPIAVLMLSRGPTREFALGRIFERATEEALKDVLHVGGEYVVKEEQQQLFARDKFHKMNCKLIGVR